jgi:hypothetical protein
MAAGPQRLVQPVPHLLPQAASVEKALLERARVLEEDANEVAVGSRRPAVDLAVARYVAREFRALAAELHHWQ